MIVTGPEMDIGTELARFAANYERDLGVRLQLQKSVNHLHPGAFEIAGPADIRLLVKARLELDQRRHRLSGLGGLGQFPHDRAVFAGAVKRLLDCGDGRVAGSLPQKLNDDVEALIGMMDDDVLLPDCREAIPAEIANPLREPRIVGGEDQIRALVDDQLRGVVEAKYTVGGKDVGRGGVELFHQKAAQLHRHRRIDGKQNGVTAPAAFERRLVMADEVLRFLFHLDLAVAEHAEDAQSHDGKAREQMVEEQRDRLFDRQEADSVPRQADETGDRGWDQGQRLQTLSVTDPLELQRQAETAIGDKRKGMGRVDRQRGQDRKHIRHEPVFEPGAVAGFEIGRVDHRHARFAEQAAQRQPGDLLVRHQLAGPLADRVELLGRGQSVLARRLDPGEKLTFEPGDAHHVELVEIVRRDRQKAQALQQRMAQIVGLGQDALIEGEPGQFPIDEAGRGTGVEGLDLDRLDAGVHPGLLLRSHATPD